MADDSSTYVEIKGSSQSQPSADAGPVARARPEASPSAAPEIDPLTLTTPRARLEYLRDFLRGLPEEKFDMRFFTRPECGTPGCIAGWAASVFRERSFVRVGDVLGLEADTQHSLFWLSGEDDHPMWAATPHQAAAVIDHLLNTGEVDWSVARKVEA